ncbi:hypothetical protein TWF718_000641 [Orbilia javanica]|uniref:Uncharacterized protein n=1 Tax=Orbilia javanica TaxID=47235 RepID=A0AAN8MU84_9PEZI
MAQKKGKGGRQPWRHRRWQPKAQQTGRGPVTDGPGQEGGFWEEGTRPSRGAGGSGGRLMEGVAEAETFRRGRRSSDRLRWEQLGGQRRGAISLPSSPAAKEDGHSLQADGHSRPHPKEDGHSLLADGHSRRSGVPIPAFKAEVAEKSSRVDSAYAEFIREFFEDTRTKPRDETWIHPRFRRNLPVPPAEPVPATATPHDQAEEQAQRSARGLNPSAEPFVPGQYGAIPQPTALEPKTAGRPRYDQYDRQYEGGISGHPMHQQKQVVDRSEYKFSPHARNFVPAKDRAVVDNGPERARGPKEGVRNERYEPVRPEREVGEKEVFKSCTLYILHHAYDVGAGYEDVHQVYARRYGGEEKADGEVVRAILKDAQYLLAEKFEESDLVAGGINGSGILKNGKLDERIKRLMREFVTEAKNFLPRRTTLLSVTLLDQPEWKALQKRDIKFSQAEKCTDLEIEIMESGLTTLEDTGRYKKRNDKVRGVEGLHQHLKQLRERQTKFRRETKKILDEMTRQRTIMYVRLSGGSGVITGSTVVDVKGAQEKIKGLEKRADGLKLSEAHKLDLETDVESAMAGPGALGLGFIDSEDDDGGIKLSPDEAKSWW